MNSASFNSKILLFGEYSVIIGSEALAIPYSLFSGKLNFSQSYSNNESSKRELLAFAKYLKNFDFPEVRWDITSFAFDVEQGLNFSSTIPHGYGLGSSGALCAAIFDRYGVKREDWLGSWEWKTGAIKLQTIFKQMESHFHGSSSGVDPLISYLNSPLHISKSKEISAPKVPEAQGEGNGAIFLLNTGRARRTEPLVNLFLEKLKVESFNKLCSQELCSLNNQLIKLFLAEDWTELDKVWRNLSVLQYENFSPMIPKLAQFDWQLGLNDKLFSLKLCGAGGGGFILGITPDFKKTQSTLSDYQLRAVYRFN